MRTLLVLLSLLFSFQAFAQKLLRGTVVDEKGSPVPAASVFLNNTSVGTRTGDNGAFQLYLPAGKYELIVSSVGFETYNQPVSGEMPDPLIVRLKVKSEQMATVVIEPYEKDGWQRWGRFFIENFIGMSAFANECKLQNPEVLRFRNSKKTGRLTVSADEPLVIENQALGYRVRYQMESFVYDFRENYLIYTGYPFFEPLEGSDRKQRRWQKNRAEAYEGSMMQFMRSLYRNRLKEDGYEVRRLQKIPNGEKARVKLAHRQNLRTETAGGVTVVATINRDSSDYYSRILQQEDYTDVIGREVLTGDSIAYAVDSLTAGLAFSDYLLVIYKKKLVPIEYARLYPKSGSQMISQVVLPNGVPLEVQSNGMYFNPTDLLTLGYWSWSEKLSRMLPFDY